MFSWRVFYVCYKLLSAEDIERHFFISDTISLSSRTMEVTADGMIGGNTVESKSVKLINRKHEKMVHWLESRTIRLRIERKKTLKHIDE